MLYYIILYDIELYDMILYHIIQKCFIWPPARASEEPPAQWVAMSALEKGSLHSQLLGNFNLLAGRLLG